MSNEHFGPRALGLIFRGGAFIPIAFAASVAAAPAQADWATMDSDHGRLVTLKGDGIEIQLTCTNDAVTGLSWLTMSENGVPLDGVVSFVSDGLDSEARRTATIRLSGGRMEVLNPMQLEMFNELIEATAGAETMLYSSGDAARVLPLNGATEALDACAGTLPR